MGHVQGSLGETEGCQCRPAWVSLGTPMRGSLDESVGTHAEQPEWTMGALWGSLGETGRHPRWVAWVN